MKKKDQNWRTQISDLLGSRGLTQRSFSNRMGIAHSHFSDVVNGKKPMNVRIAVALEYMTIGDAENWMRLQMIENIESEKKRVKF